MVNQYEVTSCTAPPPAAMRRPRTRRVTSPSQWQPHVTLQLGRGSHEVMTTQTLDWSAGDMLSISSTGATVGQFSSSLVVPQQITVLAPYLPQDSR